MCLFLKEAKEKGTFGHRTPVTQPGPKPLRDQKMAQEVVTAGTNNQRLCGTVQLHIGAAHDPRAIQHFLPQHCGDRPVSKNAAEWTGARAEILIYLRGCNSWGFANMFVPTSQSAHHSAAGRTPKHLGQRSME